MIPSVVILSFNSIDTLPATIQSARELTGEIFVIDSGSTDGTIALAESLGATVLQHPFENYGAQRNWSIDNITASHAWQLHLDADEVVSPELRAEIAALPETSAFDGYLLPRYLRFMGRLLRHNLAPTYHMRLFRTGRGRCESRHYDQHFICDGPTATLKGMMTDDIRMSLSEWTRRHNNWSDAEVREIRSQVDDGRVKGKWFGNRIQFKRALRGAYDKFPPFSRAFLLFFYRYVIRMGFLDGVEGFIFCVLQTFWFRFLVDAKLYEAAKADKQRV